jgi:hypothetical protein
MLRGTELNWTIMLGLGLQPGRDAACLLMLWVTDEDHANRVASVLRASGVNEVEIDKSRRRLTRRISWWVSAMVTIPDVSLEALKSAGLIYLSQAELLGCSFRGLLPYPQDEAT